MNPKINMDAILMEVAKALGPTIKELVQSATTQLRAEFNKELQSAMQKLDIEFRRCLSTVATKDQFAEINASISGHVGDLQNLCNSIQSEMADVKRSFLSSLQSTDQQTQALARDVGKRIDLLEEESADALKGVSALSRSYEALQASLSKDIQSVHLAISVQGKEYKDKLVENALSAAKLYEGAMTSQNALKAQINKQQEQSNAAVEELRQGIAQLVEDQTAKHSEAREFATSLFTQAAKNVESKLGVLGDRLAQSREEMQATVQNFSISLGAAKQATEQGIATAKEEIRAEVVELLRDVRIELRDASDSQSKFTASAVEKISEVAKRVDALAAEGQEVRQCAESSREKLENQTIALSEVSETLLGLQSEINAFNQTAEQTFGDVTAAREKSDTLAKSLEALEGRVATAMGQLEAQKQALDVTATEMNGFRERCADLAGVTSELVSRVDESAASAHVAISEVRREIESLVKSVDSLGESCDGRIDEVGAAVKAVVASTRESTDALRQQIQGVLEASTSSVESINQNVENMATWIGELNTKVQSYRTEVNNRVDLTVEDLKKDVEAVHEKVVKLIATSGEEASQALSRVSEDLSRKVQDSVEQTVEQKMAIARAEARILLSDEVRKEVSRIPAPKDGADGRDGKDGKDGADGRDGKDGKDGEMPRVEAYAPGKLVAEGKVVSAKGGLWQARRDTAEAPSIESPDWRAVSTGLDNIEFKTSEDGREVEMVFTLSDGTKQKSTVELPVSVWQDVYDASKEYRKADEVTHGGSVWHATRSGVLGTPGKNSDWKLKVKCGRDGKDGKDIVRHVGEFYGEWEMDKLYKQHSIVVHAGVHWMAKHDTNTRPPWATLRSNDTWLKMGD